MAPSTAPKARGATNAPPPSSLPHYLPRRHGAKLACADSLASARARSHIGCRAPFAGLTTPTWFAPQAALGGTPQRDARPTTWSYIPAHAERPETWLKESDAFQTLRGFAKTRLCGRATGLTTFRHFWQGRARMPPGLRSRTRRCRQELLLSAHAPPQDDASTLEAKRTPEGISNAGWRPFVFDEAGVGPERSWEFCDKARWTKARNPRNPSEDWPSRTQRVAQQRTSGHMLLERARTTSRSKQV